MRLDALKLLEDVRVASETVLKFSFGLNFQQFANDEEKKSAVYWQFVVIGEAMSKLRKCDPKTFDQLTDAEQVVGFRNQINHGYSIIRNTVVWQIIQENVPTLLHEVNEILKEH